MVFQQIGNINKDIEFINNQIEILELKTQLKNSIKSFKSGLSHAEERIIKFKDRSFEINQLEEYKEKRMKNKEESLPDL